MRGICSVVFLEVFSERTLVGKVEFFGNLLNAHLAVLEHHPYFEHDIVVYPVAGGTFTDTLDGFGEVFRGDAKLLGVPS